MTRKQYFTLSENCSCSYQLQFQEFINSEVITTLQKVSLENVKVIFHMVLKISTLYLALALHRNVSHNTENHPKQVY